MRIEPVPEPTPALGALFGAVALAAAAALVVWTRLALPLPICLWRAWTGFACPSCGTTRVALSLLAGRWEAAFAFNPLAFLGLVGVGVWSAASAVRALLRLPAWRVRLGPTEQRALCVAIVAAIVGNWAYLIWRGI